MGFAIPNISFLADWGMDLHLRGPRLEWLQHVSHFCIPRQVRAEVIPVRAAGSKTYSWRTLADI